MREAIVLDNEWNMGIELKVPMAVTADGYLFTRGQIDVDAKTQVRHYGDAAAQTQSCIGHINAVMAARNLPGRRILHINHYYRAGSIEDPALFEGMLIEGLRAHPNTPVTLIPVPHFYFPGIEIETDAIAATGSDIRHESFQWRDGRLSAAYVDDGVFFGGRFSLSVLDNEPSGSNPTLVKDVIRHLTGSQPTIDAGRMWVHIQAPSEDAYGDIVSRIPAAPENWQIFPIPCLTPKSSETSVTISGYAEPGLRQLSDPETGITLLIGKRFGFLDRVVARPCGGAGHDDREDLIQQTKAIMLTVKKSFAALGLDFSRVLKATTYYVGGENEDDLYANLQIRDTFYNHPGPASTGVPVHSVESDRARIAVSMLLSTANLTINDENSRQELVYAE